MKMSLCRSFLHARALPGKRAELVQAFTGRRVLQECREAVPGCLGGELLLSASEPDALCVTVLWASPADHHAWLASPVRVAQGPALAAWLASADAPVLMPVATALD